LSRTLRARDNGAADCHPLLAWRSAPHNQRMKPTSGGKACGFPARRGLSAAPLAGRFLIERARDYRAQAHAN
jgi:hypothetical protein